MSIFGALVFLTALATAHGWCQEVRLESWNWVYAEQTYPHGSGYVASMTVHSSEGAACTSDETFGFDPYTIWVDYGCRGTFDVCFETDQCSSYLLESWNWQYARYTITGAGKILSMTLTDAQSPADICIAGDTYDFMGVSAYVDDGCRANFEICFSPGSSSTVRCESWNYDQAVCDVGKHIQSAVLQKAISDAPCVRGFSFFVEDTTIVTKRGCRADFLVGV